MVFHHLLATHQTGLMFATKDDSLLVPHKETAFLGMSNRSCLLNVYSGRQCPHPHVSFTVGGKTHSEHLFSLRLHLPFTFIHSFDEAGSLCLCQFSFEVKTGCMTRCIHSFEFFSSRLLPAFIGSNLFTTTEPSATCSAFGPAFPLGLYLSYLVYICIKEPTELPPVIYTIPSIHPDPNHVNEFCRSFPFF